MLTSKNGLIIAFTLSRGYALYIKKIGSQSKIRHWKRSTSIKISLNTTHKRLYCQHSAHERQSNGHLWYSNSIQTIWFNKTDHEEPPFRKITGGTYVCQKNSHWRSTRGRRGCCRMATQALSAKGVSYVHFSLYWIEKYYFGKDIQSHIWHWLYNQKSILFNIQDVPELSHHLLMVDSWDHLETKSLFFTSFQFFPSYVFVTKS